MKKALICLLTMTLLSLLLSSLDAVSVSHIGYTPWVRVRISVDKLTCEALLQLSSNTAIRSIRVGYPPVISPNA